MWHVWGQSWPVGLRRAHKSAFCLSSPCSWLHFSGIVYSVWAEIWSVRLHRTNTSGVCLSWYLAALVIHTQQWHATCVGLHSLWGFSEQSGQGLVVIVLFWLHLLGTHITHYDMRDAQVGLWGFTEQTEQASACQDPGFCCTLQAFTA